MDVAILVTVIVFVLGAIITIWFAVWGKNGLGKIMEKGFGDLRKSGSTIARDIEKRMGDLLEVTKLLATQRGTATYKLENIGSVEVSILDMGNNEMSYNIETEKPTFATNFLVAKANEDKEFQEKEKALFGEKQPRLQAIISTLLHVELPSDDKEKCAEYMAVLLKWLDTKYFEAKKEFAESELAIGNYLDKLS